MLKKAVITQLSKTDDILDPLDYRPIFITTPFSKSSGNVWQTKYCFRRESWDTHTTSIGFRSKVFAQDAVLYCIETIQHEIEI